MHLDETLVDRARANAAVQGDKLALRFLDGPMPADWTFAELDAEARTVAAWLQERGATGGRALILHPDGPDFVAAFFGCLYAGVTAVPCYPLPHAKHAGRVEAIVRDCAADVVLSDARALELLESSGVSLRHGLDLSSRDPRWGDQWFAAPADPRTPAFLQYTSGSTGDPKGVRVTHANLMANHAMIAAAFGLSADTPMVSWLPLFHDMGLIGKVLQGAYNGAPLALMSPASFIRRPARWVQAVSDFRAHHSGGPNFAFELCAAKTTPEEREGLDLSCWKAAFCGAEPIRPATLERFLAVFAGHGLDADALFPCYGLAETTLFVSGPGVGRGAHEREVAAAALGEGLATPASGDEPTQRLVASGHTAWGEQTVRIVDPETRRLMPTGRVGEIWVTGPHVGDGYWGRPEQTEQTFGARISHIDEPRRFLRTGDLGFLDTDGRLFVSGRLKDLIILHGRNVAPQDLEQTVAEADARIRGHAVAAFTVEADGADRLVVVAEATDPCISEAARAELSRQIGRALSTGHGVALGELVLIAPGTLPRTSSGKLQRRRCRDLLSTGELRRVDAGDQVTAGGRS